MNYYPGKYAEWKADHCKEKLDMKYLRQEIVKTLLCLKTGGWWDENQLKDFICQDKNL